jgi:hypothetical protein
MFFQQKKLNNIINTNTSWRGYPCQLVFVLTVCAACSAASNIRRGTKDVLLF